MSKQGAPVSWFELRLRVIMLMSLPNSVGIDPASANEDVFKASGRLVLPNAIGRFLLKLTSQLIEGQIDDVQVDTLEQLARNFACQRTLSHKVRRGRLVYRTRRNVQTGTYRSNGSHAVEGQ
jgi:hypothetical protein